MLIIYLICINVLGFSMMWHDKRQAVKRKQRVPEKNLWFVAIVGGAVCMWISMYVFRHKTKHPQFVFGFFVLAVIDVIGMYYGWRKGILINL